MSTVIHPLQKELETYEKQKPSLLGEGEGKFVAILGDEVLGLWDTYEDALKAGFARCGPRTPFLVKQISGVDQIQFVTRDF
jgi:hypothetical protein